TNIIACKSKPANNKLLCGIAIAIACADRRIIFQQLSKRLWLLVQDQCFAIGFDAEWYVFGSLVPQCAQTTFTNDLRLIGALCRHDDIGVAGALVVLRQCRLCGQCDGDNRSRNDRLCDFSHLFFPLVNLDFFFASPPRPKGDKCWNPQTNPRENVAHAVSGQRADQSEQADGCDSAGY